jgi:glutathione S-transferase
MKWLDRYIGGRITHEASAIARYLAKRFPHWWKQRMDAISPFSD